MPKIGIVYGTGSGALRRVIVPDSDEQLDRQSWIGAGESFSALEYKEGQRPTHAEIDAELQRITGGKASRIVSAVVGADNLVKAILSADPAIDRVPEHSLVVAYSKEIIPGCTYDAQTGKFTVPARDVREAFDKETGDTIPAHTVPAKVIEPVVISDVTTVLVKK